MESAIPEENIYTKWAEAIKVEPGMATLKQIQNETQIQPQDLANMLIKAAISTNYGRSNILAYLPSAERHISFIIRMWRLLYSKEFDISYILQITTDKSARDNEVDKLNRCFLCIESKIIKGDIEEKSRLVDELQYCKEVRNYFEQICKLTTSIEMVGITTTILDLFHTCMDDTINQTKLFNRASLWRMLRTYGLDHSIGIDELIRQMFEFGANKQLHKVKQYWSSSASDNIDDLLLSFIMFKVYNKVWDGTSWGLIQIKQSYLKQVLSYLILKYLNFSNISTSTCTRNHN